MTTLKQLDSLAEKITAMGNLIYQFDKDTEKYKEAHDALANAAGCDEETLKADEALRTLKFLYENTTICELMLKRVNFLTNVFTQQIIELIESIEEMDNEYV